MKMILCLCLAFACPAIIVPSISAQKTIILIRHGEKDLTDPKNPNPDLSATGKQRAINLLKAVKKYDPEMIYSTDFIRTKGTVGLLAEKDSLQTHLYDPRKLDELV